LCVVLVIVLMNELSRARALIAGRFTRPNPQDELVRAAVFIFRAGFTRRPHVSEVEYTVGDETGGPSAPDSNPQGRTPVRLSRSTALVAAAAALVMVGGTALADPPAGVTPKTTDIVAVASPTLQSLCNQFSTDYNVTLGSGSLGYLYCFDGTGASPITTKNDPNCTIARPSTDGPDIDQVRHRIMTTDGHYCVDLALVGVRPPAGVGLGAVVFGRDLVTWAANSGGNAVTNLTDTQLKAIYTCNDAILGGSGAPVKWSEVGGTSTDAIVPALPQAGSAVRSNFLTAIGVAAPGACVVNGVYNGATIVENEGTNPVFVSAGNPTGWKDVMVPYSAGAYEGEAFYHTNPMNPGNLVLGSIDGKNPLASPGTINAGLFPVAYIYNLLAVFNDTTATPWVPTYLQRLLGRSDKSGWICSGNNGGGAALDILHAGFATASTCGAVIVH
jgi:ABC-type phosphate transport system substrate-binding protein